MTVTKIPASIKLTVLLVIMSEHIINFMIPPIIVYVVERLGERSSIDIKDFSVLSFWVGLLEFSNRTAGLIGSLFWGGISDKIGRKSSLTIILIGIGLSSLGLALSPNLWCVLSWRIIGGFFAGTIPIMKALMRDISDDSNISVLYSYFGTGYGAASIIGPLLGGFLSSPMNSDLFFFNNTFIKIFPYFYPFFAHCLTSVLALTFILKNVPQKPAGPVKASADPYSYLKSKDYLLCTFVFICIATCQFSYRSLMALWLRLDKSEDGIGWVTEVNPGIMNAFSGVIVMFLPLLFTDQIQQKFGVRNGCIFVSFLMSFPLCAVSFGYPLEDFWLMTFLVVCNGSCVAFTTILVSVISIGVSNSVTSDVAGAAIGLTQAVVAFTRGIGNGGTAVAFGYLLSQNFSFPFDFHFLFFMNVLILVIIALLLKFTLDERIEKRKTNKVEIPLLEKN